jgi:hypothetical protein
MGARTSRLGRAAITVAATIAIGAQAAWAQPALKRDLDSYFIFALQSASLKNFNLNGACNVGVNCAQPSSNSSCGVIVHENATYDQGSQIVGDVARFNRPGAVIWQLFSNKPSGLNNVSIGLPPVQSFVPPVLGNIDGDANPSCSTANQQCVVDYGDLYAACGFPAVFPACDLTKSIVVLPNSDCPVIINDPVPGNNVCDLEPGVWGNVSIQNGGRLNLVGGTYTFCNFQSGQHVNITASADTTIYMNGDLDLRDDVDFGPAPGTDCGQIEVFANGPGVVGFGRDSDINGYFCAPERLLRLGHNNNLTGRFFAEVVNADSNDRGFCCEEGGACACFDTLTPSTASVGANVTLTGNCGLGEATGVTLLCGLNSFPATIVTQSGTELVFTVPAGASGACQVKVESVSGVFTGTSTLTVN